MTGFDVCRSDEGVEDAQQRCWSLRGSDTGEVSRNRCWHTMVKGKNDYELAWFSILAVRHYECERTNLVLWEPLKPRRGARTTPVIKNLRFSPSSGPKYCV